MKLDSTNISDKAATMIREMVVKGTLPDGERINEVHLAEDLGISRTPLREGLGRLVAERMVTAEPRRGFFVAPLAVDEFEQLYDVRPILDPEALRMAGIPSDKQIERLEHLNNKLLQTKTAATAIDIDIAWHLELLAGCPNRVLVQFIEQIIARTRRYEHALFRETKNVWTAGTEHERIVYALKKSDIESACTALKQNMQSGKEPIVHWLIGRSDQH